MGSQRRQLSRCRNSMALPLTVKTETELVIQHPDPQTTTTDPETDDLGTEVVLRILIDNIEVRREPETKNIQIDLEIPANSKSITKIRNKITHGGLEFHTKI